jgi:RES domain
LWPTRSAMATSGAKRIVAPEPPARLSSIDLPVCDVATTWFRICRRRHASPLFWSRLGIYRFDSENAHWGVCYAASSITRAFQEVFGIKIRCSTPLDWSEINDFRVWCISIPGGFRGLNLFGDTLTLIDATLQCFVSSYAKSRRWGAALMDHPADLDGLVYYGRRCGAHCLALFGDETSPRKYQKSLKSELLGDLILWDEFWSMLDRLKVRVSSIPRERKEPTWSLT